MIMKLTPGEVTPITLTAYYAITLHKIQVSDSNITSCTLKIGDATVSFIAGSEGGILNVDGDPDRMHTFMVKPKQENTIQVLLPVQPGTEREVLLHHSLSYSVPKTMLNDLH